MLTYTGDHVLCDSMPLILEKDSNRFTYEEFEFNFYFTKIKTENYKVELNFQFNEEIHLYCLDRIQIIVDKKFINNIFKKN